MTSHCAPEESAYSGVAQLLAICIIKNVQLQIVDGISLEEVDGC